MRHSTSAYNINISILESTCIAIYLYNQTVVPTILRRHVLILSTPPHVPQQSGPLLQQEQQMKNPHPIQQQKGQQKPIPQQPNANRKQRKQQQQELKQLIQNNSTPTSTSTAQRIPRVAPTT